jgi:hypothetical protein
MDTNTFFNRFEIMFYSLLISIMSGLNRLRTHFLPTPAAQAQPLGEKISELVDINGPAQPQSHLISWKSIEAAFALLLLWAVLGFAAGFLIGMIKPW